MPPDTRLKTAANHILTTLATALESNGIDVPARRYLTSGQIAHDFAGEKCVEGFVVSWQAAFQGQVGFSGGGFPEADIRCAMPGSVQFEVALLRCVPVPRSGQAAPPVGPLNASGESIMDDAWTIFSTIVDTVLNGDLSDHDQHVWEVAMGSASAIGPSGGAGGVSVALFVNVL